MLKQHKIRLNLLCAWNLIHKYQDPFGHCYFTQLKLDIRPRGAFQRATYTDGVPTHTAKHIKHMPRFVHHGDVHVGRDAAALYTCKFVTVQMHSTHQRHFPCLPVSFPLSSFHPSAEQSQRLKDSAKVPCYAEERDTLTQLSISFAHLHVCGTL